MLKCTRTSFGQEYNGLAWKPKLNNPTSIPLHIVHARTIGDIGWGVHSLVSSWIREKDGWEPTKYLNLSLIQICNNNTTTQHVGDCYIFITSVMCFTSSTSWPSSTLQGNGRSQLAGSVTCLHRSIGQDRGEYDSCMYVYPYSKHHTVNKLRPS